MMTSAICIVKGISSHTPPPHTSTIRAAGVGVAASAATTTTSVASRAKTKASGTHRSDQAVRRDARAATGPERPESDGIGCGETTLLEELWLGLVEDLERGRIALAQRGGERPGHC